MPSLDKLVVMLFAPDNIWSVILRAAIWIGIALVIIVSTDKPDPNKGFKDLKANLGFFMMFLVLSGGLVYLLFGFTAS
jgi:hypothetical protein